MALVVGTVLNLINQGDRLGPIDWLKLAPTYAVPFFVSKLTLTPSRVTASDRAAVGPAAGQEPALHDIAAICGLFNLMNRIVDGLGILADDDYTARSTTPLHTGGYAGLLALLCGRRPAGQERASMQRCQTAGASGSADRAHRRSTWRRRAACNRHAPRRAAPRSDCWAR